ncbi:MAG TPA: histidine kinase, partial [Sphingobium sp.]|nr:histidine kinase [Sphingobium sp.]
DEYRRKVRIAARAWHTHRYLRPQLRRMAAIDRFKYASRKIVRWFGGAFILTGALAAAILAWRLSPLLLVIGVAVVAFAVLTGIRARRGPVAALVDMLIAYAATLQGVTKAMRGRTVTIWNPAQSR